MALEFFELNRLYIEEGLSVQEVAKRLGYSSNTVIYWMDKHGVERRTISEAIYKKHNPNGDPFKVRRIESLADAELFGLGLGLYWGEGTKSNKYSVRLGNTDPLLLKSFINFLVRIFGIDKQDLRFGLQIFSDINPVHALDFWVKELGVNQSQFHKPTVTISGSIGTYRKKSLYGVVTVIYHNKKLRDTLVNMLPR